jgi:cell division protein FtsB
MIQEIASSIKYIKTAKDIITAIADNKSLAEIKGKLIELQNALLSAQESAFKSQQEQATLIAEINKLKQDIVKIKAWPEQAVRYKLKFVKNSGTVYALIKSMANGEPPHYLCSNCFHDEIKSIMQPGKNANKITIIHCPKCKCEIIFNSAWAIVPEYAD